PVQTAVMEDRLGELEPRLDRLGASQQDRLVETLGLGQATVEERLECPEELDVMRRRVVTVLECALHLLPRDLEIGITAPEQCDRAAIHGQRERRILFHRLIELADCFPVAAASEEALAAEEVAQRRQRSARQSCGALQVGHTGKRSAHLTDQPLHELEALLLAVRAPAGRSDQLAVRAVHAGGGRGAAAGLADTADEEHRCAERACVRCRGAESRLGEVLRAGMPTECTRIEEGYLVEALEVCPDQLGDAVTQVCELLVAAIQEGEYTDALDRRCCRDLAV